MDIMSYFTCYFGGGNVYMKTQSTNVTKGPMVEVVFQPEIENDTSIDRPMNSDCECGCTGTTFSYAEGQFTVAGKHPGSTT
jgi:hypothetical protein